MKYCRRPKSFISNWRANLVFNSTIPTISSLIIIMSSIYNEKRMRPTEVGLTNKAESWAREKSKENNYCWKLFKLSLRCLFETIYEFVNFFRLIRNTKKIYFINFFFKIPIQENTFNNHLRNKLLTNKGHYNKSTDNGYFCNRRKSLLIIHTILLSKTLSNQSNYISLNGLISLSFNFINPMTTNYAFALWKLHQIPSIYFMQHWEFLNYSLLPKGIKNCLYIH